MTQSSNSKRPDAVAKPQAGSGSDKGRPTPPANEAFEKEVDEELQREWLNELWEKYSGYILAAAVAVVLGVGAYKLMETRRQAAAEAQGARYLAAAKLLADNKPEEGAQALAALGKSNDGVGLAARLRLAAAQIAAGKTADALATYEAVARERGADSVLTDFARLQTAMLTIDTAPLADIQSKLMPLVSENNPWRFNAMELLGLAALKAGKTDTARGEFEKLAGDQGVPQGIAERARIVMGSLVAADLAAKNTPPAPQQSAPQTPASAPAKAPATPAKKK